MRLNKTFVTGIFPDAHLRSVKTKGHFTHRYEIYLDNDYRQTPFVDTPHYGEAWLKAKYKILESCLLPEYSKFWQVATIVYPIKSKNGKIIKSGDVNIFYVNHLKDFLAFQKVKVYQFSRRNLKFLKIHTETII